MAAFLRPITYDTPERKYLHLKLATPARTITTGYYEFDWESLANNKTVAIAILGYGAVTSFIFIFLAMMRSLGKTHFLIEINILRFISSGIYYYNSSQEITAQGHKGTGDE